MPKTRAEETAPREALVSLGSNIDPEQSLGRALERLQEIGGVRAVSAVYQSPAIGPRPAPDYLNAAVALATRLEPRKLRQALRRIEAELGRVRSEDRYAPRTIDLDLCLLGDLVVATADLVLPDPEILERPYLARVLADLDPSRAYPGRPETLGEIALRLAARAELVPRPEVGAKLRSILERGSRRPGRESW